jgi:hypothetical protein
MTRKQLQRATEKLYTHNTSWLCIKAWSVGAPKEEEEHGASIKAGSCACTPT